MFTDPLAQSVLDEHRRRTERAERQVRHVAALRPRRARRAARRPRPWSRLRLPRPIRVARTIPSIRRPIAPIDGVHPTG